MRLRYAALELAGNSVIGTLQLIGLHFTAYC
jgi:hypothetical protein